MAVTSHGHLGVTKSIDLVLDASVEYVLTDAGEDLYGLEIDNTQNSADSFVKIFDLASGADLGNTVPDLVFRVEAGKKVPLPLAGGDLSDAIGLNMVNGIGIACVTTGGTGGTTGPTNDVKATIITS